MDIENVDPGQGISRRRFLGTLGAGAVAVGARGVLGLESAHAVPPVPFDRFGRMFELPPFADPADPALHDKLMALGARHGPLDAEDHLEVGPIRLITDPSFNGDTPPTPPNPNNFTHTAGVTFMGQFMDHDMTFDVTSRLGAVREPTSSQNARTPRFDLDSVYGGGPTVNPTLYQPDGMRFRVDTAPGGFEDLPRASDGSALIADPRNDENMMIAGLHAAVLLFHNRAVDVAVAEGISDPTEIFERARQLTTWHYQWMVLHEFLPLFVGQHRVDRAMVRRRHYRPSGSAFIPVEFQGAVFRSGHSMVRPSYRANLAGDAGGPFFGMIFDPPSTMSWTPMTCEVDTGRRGASSAGRLSFASLASRATSGRTRRSTPTSPRHCSTSRRGRSPGRSRSPTSSHSAPCSGTSPGSFHPGRRSLATWGCRWCPGPTSRNSETSTADSIGARRSSTTC